MNLRELLDRRLQLHYDSAGNPVAQQLAEPVLAYLDKRVEAGWRTLETGEGLSTLFFVMKGCEHVCVSPNVGAIELIKQACSDLELSIASARFEVGWSERVLPPLDMGRLDLVLIDGGHAFPTPMVDWYYTSGALRAGGLLVVDDVQLWPCRMVASFLAEEPGWELEADFSPRAMIFRKVDEQPPSEDWLKQPYVLRMNEELAVPAQPTGRRGRIRGFAARQRRKRWRSG